LNLMHVAANVSKHESNSDESFEGHALAQLSCRFTFTSTLLKKTLL